MFCLFLYSFFFFFFFFNDTATTEIYTLSLHDALPTSAGPRPAPVARRRSGGALMWILCWYRRWCPRSEEHTSELQSLTNLVCRLLLEKKKNKINRIMAVKKKHKTVSEY